MSAPRDETNHVSQQAALEPNLEPALEPLLEHTAELITHARSNPALARTLRQLAHALLAALPADDVYQEGQHLHGTTNNSPQAANTETYTRQPNNDHQHEPYEVYGDAFAAESIPEPASAADIDGLLSGFGNTTPQAAPDALSYNPERTAAHLRLKARACRWLEHHALTDDPAALAERYTLIDEAKANDCLLWMFNRDYVNPQNPDLVTVAHLMDLTADAVLLWEDAYDEPEGRTIAQLVAAVQSALRVAVTWVNSQDNWTDSDQKGVYQELNYYGEREGHYLEHMRLNNAADPTDHAHYRDQLEALRNAIQTRRDAHEERKKLRKKLRYHVTKLLERPHNADSHWQRVLTSLEPFWQGDDDNPSLPADIRDDVRPLLDLQDVSSLNDEERDWFETISAVFDQDVSPTPDTAPSSKDTTSIDTSTDTSIDTAISPEVRRLVPYFAGRTIVIIGGDPKPHNSAALEQHFNCQIDWIKTTAHKSIYHFLPKLTRDDVVMVALLIRWSSHVFGEVKATCDDHNKLFVRLPRGYGVNMFAHEVLEQVGSRLGV